MHRTLVIRREYLHFIPKYSRYEKRHKNLAAHVSPAFRVEEGDQVTVGQCRPLSKTVRLHGSGWRHFGHRGGGIMLDHFTDIFGSTGPLQRTPCPPPYRQGCQAVPKVLDDIWVHVQGKDDMGFEHK